jgi:hypothetical protein
MEVKPATFSSVLGEREPLVIRLSWWKTILAVLVFLAFSGVGLAMALDVHNDRIDRVAGGCIVALFGGMLVIAIFAAIRAKFWRGLGLVTDQGIVTMKSDLVRWDEIVAVSIVDLGRLGRQLIVDISTPEKHKGRQLLVFQSRILDMKLEKLEEEIEERAGRSFPHRDV